MNISRLKKALAKSWSRETSADPDRWSGKNPAWGQCAVTALVVQDYFGGELLRTAVETNGEKISHYWNKLPNGKEADLTRSQFAEGTAIPEGEPRTREYVLSYPATARRYEILEKTVREKI